MWHLGRMGNSLVRLTSSMRMICTHCTRLPQQAQSPVDPVTMSPVERTAAWVLNNGQYEDEQEEGQSREDNRHIEKVRKKQDRTVVGDELHSYLRRLVLIKM